MFNFKKYLDMKLFTNLALIMSLILKLMLFWQEKRSCFLGHPGGYAVNKLFIYFKFRFTFYRDSVA